jgi:hypothetical protein
MLCSFARASVGMKVWLATALLWRGSMEVTGARTRLSSVLNHAEVSPVSIADPRRIEPIAPLWAAHSVGMIRFPVSAGDRGQCQV